jgi:hypothetical protein
MSSYLSDELDPAPIIVKGTPVSAFIIITITLAFFLFFWIWILTKVNKSVTAAGSAVGGGKLLLACEPGQCGTNMITGAKRCPASSTDIVLIDPASEVCNPQFRCTAFQTPYALLPSGGTSELGICAIGDACRCLKNAQCASHVAVVFVTTNGTLYNESGDNRFVFAQLASRSDKGVSSIQFTDAGTNYCGVKASNLNRITGACTFTDKDFQNPKATLKIATDCINSNPCIIGSLVFDTTNPTNFAVNGVDIEEVRNTPVTCVLDVPVSDNNGTQYPGGKCPAGYVPYWDQAWQNIKCSKINLEQITA